MITFSRAIWLIVGTLFFLTKAQAAEFYSVAEVAILYDAPSLKAKKLFIAPAGMPVEKMVLLGNWSKVRDVSGKLFWLENRVLSSQRKVVVIRPLVSVRQAANESSTVVFRVAQKVALEWLETDAAGWVKVRHPDGALGYVKSAEVWGE